MTTTRAAGAAIAMLAMGAAGSALAARPDTRDMTCDQATTLVRQYKAIVFTTGPHLYDRYVSSEAACGASRRAIASTAPTMDMQSCRIGYRCEDQPSN